MALVRGVPSVTIDPIMGTPEPGAANITELLMREAAGDSAARSELSERLYHELRALASRFMTKEAPGHTLQPTALANEAFIRMAGDRGSPQNLNHFLALAARHIRRILVDHARRRARVKRGGGVRPISIDSVDIETTTPGLDLLALEEAMTLLERDHPREAQVAELRFFGGLQEEAIAARLGVSLRTVQDDWRFARAKLRTLMNGEHRNGVAT
ncbi:MAG: sigma-70 family RNA polymerase sigma factor [Phycisphaeraceae bacterium]|nr:sigma-70 family RNA polymerase sigma factor [Phycisphaeraceae bacterium]